MIRGRAAQERVGPLRVGAGAQALVTHAGQRLAALVDDPRGANHRFLRLQLGKALGKCGLVAEVDADAHAALRVIDHLHCEPHHAFLRQLRQQLL